VISLVPNMLPVTLIGAWLMLSGRGIEFSNGLALTVAFGVAVDDTLHVLNRLRLNGGIAHFQRARVFAALEEVTPALVTTSLVLVLGMGGTLFAENKGVSDFGKIAMAVYVLALIADLIVLPAALAVFGPRRGRQGKEEPS
jgi:predicted RND superfamily exporter protein